jgi:predicted regulator of Ras-like GTPase activity (Roadblock/LC7/MglB family)
MVQSLASALSSLRDVEGTIGSFVVNGDGVLVAQDLPAYFAGVAEEVGPRVHRLCDALSLSEGAVSTCTVRYSNHKLALRSVNGALLAVLTVASVNAPALRMAMNLVARKCAAQNLSNPSEVSSSTQPPPSVAPSTATTTAPPTASPPSIAAASSGVRSLSSTAATLPAMVAAQYPIEPSAPPETHRSYAPEGGATSKKERATFFRGKRIG